MNRIGYALKWIIQVIGQALEAVVYFFIDLLDDIDYDPE